MGVEHERKRVELLDEVEDLTARLAGLKEQVSASDKVIAIYDPAYTPEAPTAPKRNRKKTRPALPPELEDMDKSAAVLEALREAGRPITSTDCSAMIVAKIGIAEDAPGLSRFTEHVSATLNNLMKRNRVRAAGINGNRRLWEIAA